MRRLLVLATTLFALIPASPAISNGWRQNPDTDWWSVTVIEGLWHIEDKNVGELLRNVRLITPATNSFWEFGRGGWAHFLPVALGQMLL